MKIPLIGLGTYELTGKKCQEVIEMAIDLGYRHFDTAAVYENHRDMGKALKKIDRKEIFLTSKLWIETQIDDHAIESSCEKACDLALEELDTDYLDLYLIHWPVRSKPLEEILKAMYRLKEKGKIFALGVSNYTQHHLQDAYDAGINPAYNQIELHPLLSQCQLVDFAHSHGTETIAYRPFGKGRLPNEIPLFSEIGKKYQKTPGQVILRWITQRNIAVIPKASSENHLRENLDIFDFELTQEEMGQINDLNQNFRFCTSDRNEFDY